MIIGLPDGQNSLKINNNKFWLILNWWRLQGATGFFSLHAHNPENNIL